MKKQEKLSRKIHRFLKKLNQREYLHHLGPKKYKLKEHLFAILMKEALRISFRRLEEILNLFGIKTPTYSALCKSRKRIPRSLWNSFLSETSNLSSTNYAIDSTGFSKTNPSFHYVKRIDSKKPIKSFAKLSAIFAIDSRKFVALKVRNKPSHDVKDFNFLIRQIPASTNFYADTAYDAEFVHEKCFKKKIQTFIKPRKNVKRGFYRRKQMKNYSEKTYHQRSLIEAGFGSLKRKYGGNVLAKRAKTVETEIFCKAICHNLNLFN